MQAAVFSELDVMAQVYLIPFTRPSVRQTWRSVLHTFIDFRCTSVNSSHRAGAYSNSVRDGGKYPHSKQVDFQICYRNIYWGSTDPMEGLRSCWDRDFHILYLFGKLSLTPWLMELRGSMPHSQGLSNNPYPEPNQPNYPHWYLSLQGPF